MLDPSCNLLIKFIERRRSEVICPCHRLWAGCQREASVPEPAAGKAYMKHLEQPEGASESLPLGTSTAKSRGSLGGRPN